MSPAEERSGFVIKFWGVRGSVPVPGPDTAEFGGNTSCTEVRVGDTLIVVDAGTGIRSLGNSLIRHGQPVHAHLLITHTHWDHLCGFPFFSPMYDPRTRLWLHGRGHFGSTLEEIVSNQMKYSYFPVRASLLPASIQYDEVDRDSFTVDSVTVRAMNTNHPVLSLAYRLSDSGKSVVFTGDHEPFYDFVTDGHEHTTQMFGEDEVAETVEEQNRHVVEFASGADLIVADAQYTPEEYQYKKGWGHMTYEQAVQLAVEAEAKQLAITHHDPERTDSQMQEIEARAREYASKVSSHPLTVFAARENMEVAL